MAKVNGWYLKSLKWRVFADYDCGKRPKDIKDKFNLKITTLWKYYEEWKIWY